MQNNKYNNFYSKKPVSELIRQLRSHRISGNVLEEDWYEALKTHLEERELTNEAKATIKFILSADHDTLKSETSIGQSIDESEKQNRPLPFVEKYPSLRTLSGIIAVFAWIVAALTVIIMVALFSNSSGEGSWILTIGTLAAGSIMFIVLLAYSEVLKVFVDIEENTRRSAMMPK